ncbi:ATP-binding cassette domain-containing protein, partial [Enterococcus faecalis]|uniref:ATP-binding cassette domain-containing protein n=2 Tax=Bacillota TaxID=1239 RepID=UPI003D6B8574
VFNIDSSGEKSIGNKIVLNDVIVTNPAKTEQIAWYEDIVIPTNSVIALQGPNGCGKSSLVKCLNRYYPHIQGTIRLFGRDQSSFDQKELTS